MCASVDGRTQRTFPTRCAMNAACGSLRHVGPCSPPPDVNVGRAAHQLADDEDFFGSLATHSAFAGRATGERTIR